MEDQIELKKLIKFVENFDSENPNWTGLPKIFAKTHPNAMPINLLPKFLGMKTLFELHFNRDLKSEITDKPHGGYRDLEAFKMAEISYDFTMEFIRTYKANKTYKTYMTYKTCEQIEGAVRSGKQNIVEGSQRAAVSSSTELQLIDVARASFEEALQDLLDFIKNNKLSLWDKNDQRVLAIRKLAYKTNKSYKTYMTYMINPESAANCAICLINQTNYLLDQLLRSLKRKLW